MRWHLERFLVEPFPGSASYTLDVYPSTEEEGGDPASFGYHFDNVFRGKAEEGFLGDLVGLALWEHWQAFPVATRDFFLLHAGAVVIDGGAVLMPAPPDAGKTSLTLALLRGGAAYLSDEFGAIDPVSGRAYPVARPMALDERALTWFPGVEDRLVDKGVPVRVSKRYLRPEDIGATTGAPAPVRALVVPEPDFRGPVRLEPLTVAEALESITPMGLNLAVYAERGVALLSRLLSDAPSFRISGGDPASRAAAIRGTLG